MVNWLPDVSEVDRPGSSSASIAGLLMVNTGGGEMARSGIGCWVAAVMDYPCRANLRRIVRATKVATWSHPFALFSIIGTNVCFNYWTFKILYNIFPASVTDKFFENLKKISVKLVLSQISTKVSWNVSANFTVKTSTIFYLKIFQIMPQFNTKNLPNVTYKFFKNFMESF